MGGATGGTISSVTASELREEEACTESKVLSDKKEVMLGIWHSSGTLWVHLLKARNLGVVRGKVYAKTYLLPHGQSSKQKSETVAASVSEIQFNSTMSVCLACSKFTSPYSEGITDSS